MSEKSPAEHGNGAQEQDATDDAPNKRLVRYRERHADTVRLLLSCPDRPGIVAMIAQFFRDHGGNISTLSEYCTSPRGGQFFARVEAVIPDLHTYAPVLEAAFARLATDEWQMEYTFSYPARLKRVAIFVSRWRHCLLELLWQWQAGDLLADLACVISNHPDCRSTVEHLGIPYHEIPVTKTTKAEAEAEQSRLLAEAEIDLVVLARYMQILSPEFVAQFPRKIINIHHSFLPAFIGGNPYAQAYERGVKLIGATSHYVTDDLDQGPIIEQDVQRVTHRERPEDLRRVGAHIERVVLARAVNLHLEDRILVHGNKTVIF